jgi:hypothetical protein
MTKSEVKRVRPVIVLLKAVAFGEAGGIEPVAAPALAVMWIVEQLVEQLGR